MEDKTVNFTGFMPETFEYLMGIQFNNRRDWYEENKSNYREYVLKPFQLLSTELAGYMLTIDKRFETRSEKIISRIYRDVRFSKDKSPYRSSVWITYRRMNRDWKFDPCFFFEITPSIYRYGMGFYTAEKETMDSMRRIIDSGSDDFREILDLYENQKIFLMEGDKYKKILDKGKPDNILDWYQRKNIYFMHTEQINKKVFSSDLAGEITNGFEIMKPFYLFLWRLKMENEEKSF